MDQALIPRFIFAPEGTHRGYGTWQLMMSEEGFPVAQNVYWWLPSDESSAIPIYLVYMHTSAASPALYMSANVAFSCRKASACVMKCLLERICFRASPFPMLNTPEVVS